MGRIEEIDICKGIAILTVIWHHSLIVYPINVLNVGWCKIAWLIDHTYFMQLFFLVSGYLLAFSNISSCKSIIYRKAKRLLIPYFCYEILNFLLKLSFPTLVNRKVEIISLYFYQMLFQGGELWFLYVLFLLFVIWTYVLKRTNKIVHLSIIGILILICCLFQISQIDNLLLLGQVVRYSPFFIIGYCLKSIKLEKLFRKHIVLIITIVYISLCVLLLNVIMGKPFIWFLISFVGCYFVWSISYKLKFLRLVNKSLSYFGKYSLPLYWLNGFALVISRTISIKVCPYNNTVLLVACIFVICLTLEVVGVQIIKKAPVFSKFVGF